MLSFTDKARMISVAAFASPKATAAALLDPITSANVPVSRTSRVRALDKSHASMAVIAMISEPALVSTPRTVSFRASDSFPCQATMRRNQGLRLVMAMPRTVGALSNRQEQCRGDDQVETRNQGRNPGASSRTVSGARHLCRQAGQ